MMEETSDPEEEYVCSLGGDMDEAEEHRVEPVEHASVAKRLGIKEKPTPSSEFSCSFTVHTVKCQR